MNTTIPDTSKIKSITHSSIKKIFSKSESELKPYIAKGLMATLTACIFIPLFSSGFAVASIAALFSAIGGDLVADLIFSFYEKHKKKGCKDLNIELIEFLQKRLKKSKDLQNDMDKVFNQLEIYNFLEKIIDKKDNQWIFPYFLTELKKANIYNSSQTNITRSRVGNNGKGAKVKVKGNIINVGRDYEENK